MFSIQATIIVRSCTLVLLACLSIPCSVDAQLIEVNSGTHPRANSIIEVKLDKPLNKRHRYQIRNIDTGRSTPVQVVKDSQVVFILPDTLEAGQSARYKIEKCRTSRVPFKLVNDQDGLEIQVDNKPVLQYHSMLARPAFESPDYYARSGFVHPLYSPSGNILTDDFPVGHLHQHGIMMAWVSTRFKNETPDFWNQHLEKGNVRHVTVLSLEEGPVYCRARIQLQHYTPHQQEILEEIWTLTVYPFSGYFLFDIQSDQHNTTNDTLILNKYHYGGMAFRGSREWNIDDKENYRNTWNILTDSGYTVADGNGKHAAYVCAEGLINGRRSGVTVYGFPENFRYPQAIRVHPVMPYWCYAPVIDDEFRIVPNATYHSRYRYYVYDGEKDGERLKGIYGDIVKPPLVRLIQG